GHQVFQLTLGQTDGAEWTGGSGTVGDGLAALAAWKPHMAFIGMHGSLGEDGCIQGALEVLNIPYQGADVASSAVAMDKDLCKRMYRHADLPVAEDLVLVGAGDGINWDDVASTVGLPLVLKTAHSGSSVGVEIADTVETLATRGTALLAEGRPVVAEGWLPGREFTCPVLEDRDGIAEALPLIEIKVKGARFFDYATKYDPDAVDEICPAPVDEALGNEMADLALRAHHVLGCRDYSRTDFMLDGDGRPRLLETNTLPGLTQASLFPLAASKAGMTFPDLVNRLVQCAAARDPGASGS
ncbi:MAG: D-alanine--D-alanine ligase, partial [Myxococcota bacterium]|nr:D-alanine--D-alanine ligase [Myxococcota bacterium]